MFFPVVFQPFVSTRNHFDVSGFVYSLHRIHLPSICLAVISWIVFDFLFIHLERLGSLFGSMAPPTTSHWSLKDVLG